MNKKSKKLPLTDPGGSLEMKKPTWRRGSGPRAKAKSKAPKRSAESRNDLYRDEQGNMKSSDEIEQIREVLQKLADVGDERLLEYFQGLCSKVLPEMFSVLRDAANNGDISCAKFLIDHGAGRSRESKPVDTGGIDLINDVFIDQGIEVGKTTDPAVGEV